MNEAAFLDASLPFTSNDRETVVRSGPFDYRLAGICVDDDSRAISLFNNQPLPRHVKEKLIELGLTTPGSSASKLSGGYVGYRLLAQYRIQIHGVMKANPFMTALRDGVAPEAEQYAIDQEIALRHVTARACREMSTSAAPHEYRIILENIARHVEASARALTPHAHADVDAFEIVSDMRHILYDAASSGPAEFAAALLPLMAGENVRGSQATNEPCLYDLFRSTPSEVVRILKDKRHSPFRTDPRGPVEMLACLGPYGTDDLDRLEALLRAMVGKVGQMYRRSLSA